MRKRCSSFRVVERCGHEDEARQDESQRGESEREGGGHTQRVVDAGADVAVASDEERRRAERARKLGPAPDHDAQVSRAPPSAGDGVAAHSNGEVKASEPKSYD